MSAKKSIADDRARAWTFIGYPESLPPNWLDMLQDLHIPVAVSPLHDRDVNGSTGEVKKAHHHIVLYFEGKKSYEQVVEIVSPFCGSVPQRVHSLSGEIRYFCHLDNPEKAQYSPDDIRAFGGFDVREMLAPTSAQRYALIAEMRQWISDNHVFEFEDLFDYAAAERSDDWFPLLCDSCAYVIKLYLSSRRHRFGK